MKHPPLLARKLAPRHKSRRFQQQGRGGWKGLLAHGGELVAGVADEHAGLADGAVADRDALDEAGSAGRHGRRAHASPVPRSSRRGGEGRDGRGCEERGRGAERRSSCCGVVVGGCLVRDFLAK